MKTVLVIASQANFDQEMEKLVMNWEGSRALVRRTGNVQIIGDTRYKWIPTPERLRGHHGVEVVFTGPVPAAGTREEWEREVACARQP